MIVNVLYAASKKKKNIEIKKEEVKGEFEDSLKEKLGK